MARRKQADGEASMDSLLDALTNVVGILLLVLILTSLNMSSVAKKIVSNLEPVSEEQFESLKVAVDSQRQNRETLQTSWADLEDKQEVEEDELTQLRSRFEELEEENPDMEAATTDVAAIRERITALKEENEELVAQNTDLDENLQEFRTVISNEPVPELAEPEVLTLPSSRRAPEDAEPRYVICRGNKLYWIGDVYTHLLSARKVIDSQFQQLVYKGNAMGYYVHDVRELDREGKPTQLRRRDDEPPLRRFRYDGAAIKAYFEANPQFGGEQIGYQVEPSGDQVRLRILLREEGGWEREQFRFQGSPLHKGFNEANQRGHYLMFLVAPDSFRVYTDAREMATSMGIPAGWQVWTDETFVPTPAVHRTQMTYDPREDGPDIASMELLAAALQPALESNAATAEPLIEPALAAAAQIQDASPEQKEDLERRINGWGNSMKYMAREVARVPEVTESFRSAEEIYLEPSAPAIPLIRLFSPSTAPPSTVRDLTPRPPGPASRNTDILD